MQSTREPRTRSAGVAMQPRTYDAFIETLVSRRSIRRYRPEPISAPQIDDLLLHATAAPSAHNRQPWRFRVLIDSREKAVLAAAMAEQLRSERIADGDDADTVAADTERSKLRIGTAPALILVSLSMQDMDHYPDPRRRQAEYLMAVQSVAMAGQNLLLGIHASGLGACWLCAPLFCPRLVVDELDLPPDWEPQGLITLGHPADTGNPRPRHALDHVRKPAKRSSGYADDAN